MPASCLGGRATAMRTSDLGECVTVPLVCGLKRAPAALVGSLDANSATLQRVPPSFGVRSIPQVAAVPNVHACDLVARLSHLAMAARETPVRESRLVGLCSRVYRVEPKWALAVGGIPFCDACISSALCECTVARKALLCTRIAASRVSAYKGSMNLVG